MNAIEYKATLAKLGLSPYQGGAFLGVAGRSSQRYAADGPPYHVAMLLRLMQSRGITADEATALMKGGPVRRKPK